MKGFSDEALKTIVVTVILLNWTGAVVTGLVYPDRKVDATISTMMGAVAGYFLLGKMFGTGIKK